MKTETREKIVAAYQDISFEKIHLMADVFSSLCCLLLSSREDGRSNRCAHDGSPGYLSGLRVAGSLRRIRGHHGSVSESGIGRNIQDGTEEGIAMPSEIYKPSPELGPDRR